MRGFTAFASRGNFSLSCFKRTAVVCCKWRWLSGVQGGSSRATRNSARKTFIVLFDQNRFPHRAFFTVHSDPDHYILLVQLKYELNCQSLPKWNEVAQVCSIFPAENGVLLYISTCFGSFYIIRVYINPLKTKRRLLYLKTHFVPRSKHFSSRL